MKTSSQCVFYAGLIFVASLLMLLVTTISALAQPEPILAHIRQVQPTPITGPSFQESARITTVETEWTRIERIVPNLNPQTIAPISDTPNIIGSPIRIWQGEPLVHPRGIMI